MSHNNFSLSRIPFIRSIIKVAKTIILPGFHGLSLYEVSKFFFKEISDTKLSDSAAAVTFNFIMALPPTLLFLFSLVPYLPLSGAEKTINDILKLVTPNYAAYKNVSTIVFGFMHTQRKDVLSYGILLTLYFSSNGILGLMRSFDRSMSVYKKRSGFARRWTAIKLTLVLILVAMASLAVFIIQNRMFDKLLRFIFHGVLAVKIASFIILMAMVFLGICIIYKYAPSLTHRFNFVSTGSIFATIVSMLVSLIFFFLVNNFIHYNKVYGSIGSIIAFMVWVWLNTLVILIGYELNVSILLGKISKAKNGSKANH
jgi:membrane protein